MNKKLIYFDSFSIDSFHEVFNASSLKMFSCIYNNITYYSSRSSYKSVVSLAPELKSIRHKTLFQFDNYKSSGNAIRHCLAFLYNLAILLFCKKDTVIVINYNSLWGLPLLNSIVEKRNLKCLIICHGEMEYFFFHQNINWISRKSLELFLKESFTPATNLFFCVLGSNILHNLQKILPASVSTHFISFEHTFIPRDVNPMPSSDNSINLAVVGTIRDNQSLEDLIRLSTKLRNERELKFYALGRVFCNISKLTDAGIITIPDSDKQFVDRAILNSYIDKMDAVILLAQPTGYQATASASILEAINNEKYIICLDSSYNTHIFSSVNPGSIFSSLIDIEEFLKTVRKKDLHSIDFQINKNRFTPQREASIFKKTLTTLNFI